MATIGKSKFHEGRTRDDGWTCNCGKSSENNSATLAGHQDAAARAAYKRLDEISASVVIAMTYPSRDKDAVRLLGEQSGGWVRSGRLRGCAVPFYDHRGHLSAALDWPAILAAVEDGTLADYTVPSSAPGYTQEISAYLLVVAASLAGHAAVTLADLDRLLTWPEQKALRELLANRLAAE